MMRVLIVNDSHQDHDRLLQVDPRRIGTSQLSDLTSQHHGKRRLALRRTARPRDDRHADEVID
jgi:hypothetical protein